MKIKITRVRCKRYGHQWTPRKKRITVCPKCKSPYFDREKKRE